MFEDYSVSILLVATESQALCCMLEKTQGECCSSDFEGLSRS